MKRITTLIGLGLFLSMASMGQFDGAPWWKEAKDGHKKTFKEIQKEFYEYWKDKDINVKGNGYKVFKRWEYHWANYVKEDGTLPDSRADVIKYIKELQQDRLTRGYANGGKWKCIGPFTYKNNGSWSAGQGRINVFIADPNDPKTYYAGGPNGGIWKSPDEGQSWEPLSDFISLIGVSGIAVAKSDGLNKDATIYISTGDDDGRDCAGVGVWKSTDGGVTWNESGSVQGNGGQISISTKSNDKLVVATSTGVYYTDDAGGKWTKSSGISGRTREAQFKPGDDMIVYAATDKGFFRSTDGGKSFSSVSGTGSGSSRVVFNVTAENPEIVYVMTNPYGVYKSTNSGQSFTKTSGTAPGFSLGQSWYDMALAVSDNNPDILFTGFIDTWKSTNSGQSWTKISRWNQPESSTYTHADIHYLKYWNGNLHVGSDGGVYVSKDDGGSFSGLSTNGLATSQFYKLSGHPSDASILVGGLQDNGGYFLRGGTWNCFYGADGMDAAVQGNEPGSVYGFIQSGGGPYKSVNGGPGKGVASLPGGGKWVTPLTSDKDGNLYAGGSKMYKYIPASNNWTALSGSFTGSLDEIEISTSDTKVIYAVAGKTLYKSTNGGSSWTTSTIPSGSNISSVEVDENNPQVIWASAQGKVYKSSDGGSAWDDMSTGLPDIRTDIIKKAIGDNEELYVGNNTGVWYRNASMDKWEEFSKDLPHVTVTDLEINEKAGVIRAATYGRGIWESPLATHIGISEEINTESQLVVYPSPAKDNITLSFNIEKPGSYTIEVKNVLGQNVFTEKVVGHMGEYSKTISLKGQVNGMYMVIVKSRNIEITKKILKQ